VDAYFSNARKRLKRDVEASYAMLRGCSSRLTEGLYQILFVMLKHGGEVRQGVIAFLDAFLRVNDGRGKMHIHPQVVASHGGACNLSAVALRLALPFCDPQTGKYDKISPSYVRSRAL
jgi:Ubiquitin fusion degradation protein 2